jgi:hypothetical protein
MPVWRCKHLHGHSLGTRGGEGRSGHKFGEPPKILSSGPKGEFVLGAVWATQPKTAQL